MTSTLILYTLDEVFKNYPNIERRGWTEEHLKLWLEQDIIAGVLNDDFEKIRIEKESVEDFIAYHNSFVLKRVEKMEEQLRHFKKN